MFGFPTQVRYLYTREPPRRREPWPPEGALDRDMRIAISEFAPGNEVVREKLVYTVVGLAGFRPPGTGRARRRRWAPIGRVGLCEICKAIDPGRPTRPAACPSCRNSAGWSIRPLSRPRGSAPTVDAATGRAVTRPARCETLARLLPKAGHPAGDRLGCQHHTTSGLRRRLRAHAALAGQRRRRQRCSRSPRPTGRDGGVLVPELAPGMTAGAPQQLRARRVWTTDVLVARPEHAQQGGVSATSSTRRRDTLLELCVDRAPRRLDEPGVRAARPRGGHDGRRARRARSRRAAALAQPGRADRPQLFLADAIENGAGFVTFLADPGRFAGAARRTRAR